MNSSPSGAKQDVGDKPAYWGTEEVHNPLLRHQSAEHSTSGDELVKVRKPYTITKQRERWTEEEHEKFLEALKLYGRAWRRIEEHIGTKTAVQIRSHAQKFFSKLEREQAAGGILAGTVQDIDIPPPRPKRKPSHPYPRKANATAFEAGLASPSALPSPVSGVLVRPASVEVLERCKSELKLFGQTVVVPTVSRAVAPVVEGKVQRDAEFHEAKVVGVVAPELMPNDESPHGKDDHNTETPSSKFHEQQQQFPGVDMSALYYTKFWERFAETVYPFGAHGVSEGASVWPFGYHRPGVGASPPCWSDFSATSLNEITASVMRAIMSGSHPSAPHLSESSSAALAAATVAAASAWWALQGSVPPPGFSPSPPAVPVLEAGGNQLEKQASEDSDQVITQNGEMAMDDENVAVSPSRNVKRQQSSVVETQDACRKRVRLRSSTGSNTEKQESEVIKCYAPPPSSSGSDDGNGNAELTEQLNGDGDASGNSGPSSNSSRCGTAEAAGKTDESSSDKDRNEGKAVLEETTKALKNSAAGFNPHHPHTYRGRKLQQRAARPSRSSGSDGEQRKEVSHEGRMAFQALFSHQKLPQTFSLKADFKKPFSHAIELLESVTSEDQTGNMNNYNDDNNNNECRYSCDKSPNRTTSSLKLSGFGFDCADSDSSPVKCKPSDDYETQEECSPASRNRRRSGFVPYRRACESPAGGLATPTSCKAEENQLVKSIAGRLIDEELKA